MLFGIGVIDDRDVVHGFGTGGYRRTYRPNLGSQDSYTMFEMGPAMAANVASGNLYGSFPLFSSQGAGFATSLALHHNSLETESTTMGRGWSHSYDLTLDHMGSMSLLRLGDGRRVEFQVQLVTERFDFMARILEDDPVVGQNTVLTKDGTRFIFRADGKLDRITAPHSASGIRRRRCGDRRHSSKRRRSPASASPFLSAMAVPPG